MRAFSFLTKITKKKENFMRRLYQKRQKNTYLINLERWEIPSLNFF